MKRKILLATPLLLAMTVPAFAQDFIEENTFECPFTYPNREDLTTQEWMELRWNGCHVIARDHDERPEREVPEVSEPEPEPEEDYSEQPT